MLQLPKFLLNHQTQSHYCLKPFQAGVNIKAQGPGALGQQGVDGVRVKEKNWEVLVRVGEAVAILQPSLKTKSQRPASRSANLGQSSAPRECRDKILELNSGGPFSRAGGAGGRVCLESGSAHTIPLHLFQSAVASSP